jgi:hypothetical protein
VNLITLPKGTSQALLNTLTPLVEGDGADHLRGLPLGQFADRLNYALADHQAASLKLAKRITAIVAPRQAGKSRGVAVLALHRAQELPGLHVLVVSAGELAAARLLETIKTMAMVSDGIKIDGEPTQNLIRFTNGSWIRCVPQSARAIRGWTIDLLIIDEAALVDDDIIQASAIPTTNARPNARIVMVSSPLLAEGTFYDTVVQGDQGSSVIESYRWSLLQSPWISDEVIETARQTLTPQRFAAEYEGVFPEDGVGILIPRDLIRQAQERDLPGGQRGAFGIDVADEGADWTMIYRNRGGVIRFVEKLNGNPTQTADRVAAHMRRIPDVPAVVDAIGVGSGVASRLQQMNLRVAPFKANWRANDPRTFRDRKAETFWALRIAFEDGLIDLDPEDKELADELAGLRYEITPFGKTQVESKDSMRARGLHSPDRADAVAMAFAAEPMDLNPRGELGVVRRRSDEPRSAAGTPEGLRVRSGEGASLKTRRM